MKKTTLLILILISTKSISQIYFSPNASMYVKNEVLYVQQDINLASTSNLYLRNNSQLLQGTTGVSSNSGAGVLLSLIHISEPTRLELESRFA